MANEVARKMMLDRRRNTRKRWWKDVMVRPKNSRMMTWTIIRKMANLKEGKNRIVL